jgi:hypothetical protein
MSEMNDNAELIDILLDPEDFDIALEIHSAFQLVVRRLQARFWESLKRYVDELVSQLPGEFANWQCQLRGSNPSDNYFDLSLTPKRQSEAKPRCFPCLQQQTPGTQFQLFYGIVWSEQVGNNEPRMPEFEELKRRVRDELKLGNTSGGWWVGGRYLEIYLYRPDTLRQLARDGTLQRLLGDQLIELFMRRADCWRA